MVVSHARRAAGFTLLEILTCLLLLSVISFFSLSYTPSLYKKNQLQALTSEIKSSIHIAKMQALIEGKPLMLAPLYPANWSNGMELIIDNPNHQKDKPLYEWHWKPANIHVEWHGFQSNEYLLFASDLRASHTNGYFLIKNANQQIKLVVNRLGRVRQLEIP